MRFWILLLAIATAGTSSAVSRAQSPVVLRPSFDNSARLADWTMDGSGAWAVRDGLLALVKAGVPGGPIRRPAGLAILKSAPLGHVTVEAEVRSDQPVDLLVRDVNLVVGWQSPTRFYYIHLAGRTDEVHNGIFLVNDADRKRLDQPTSVPQLRDQAWHRVRVERDPASGRIAVFVDGGATPVLEAIDRTLAAGRIGVGSFDETAEFRNITVTAR
jgi:hypothetical protein